MCVSLPGKKPNNLEYKELKIKEVRYRMKRFFFLSSLSVFLKCFLLTECEFRNIRHRFFNGTVYNFLLKSIIKLFSFRGVGKNHQLIIFLQKFKKKTEFFYNMLVQLVEVTCLFHCLMICNCDCLW